MMMNVLKRNKKTKKVSIAHFYTTYLFLCLSYVISKQ